ncbi:MAG TPA: copper resistance protein B [Steroidobacteraceae bacterium]
MKRLLAAALALFCTSLYAQGQSQLEHVPPDPPRSHLHDMSYRDMTAMMGMDDRKRFGKVTLERLEWQPGEDSFGWDTAAWYGGDFDKLRFEAEGEREDGDTRESRLELSWDRIVSRWWNLRTGVRHDGGPGPSRDWLAVGAAGLAPGFIEVEASLYYGEQGRSALRLATQRDLLLTQRLVLQPELELAAYGRDDAQKQLGAGLSDLKAGLRLRYEWRREFAPYLGARWVSHFGDTADFRRAAGEKIDEWQWLAGIRAWF